MEVNYFQILLIDVTFYANTLIYNVLLKQVKHDYNRDHWWKG